MLQSDICGYLKRYLEAFCHILNIFCGFNWLYFCCNLITACWYHLILYSWLMDSDPGLRTWTLILDSEWTVLLLLCFQWSSSAACDVVVMSCRCRWSSGTVTSVLWLCRWWAGLWAPVCTVGKWRVCRGVWWSLSWWKFSAVNSVSSPAA